MEETNSKRYYEECKQDTLHKVFEDALEIEYRCTQCNTCNETFKTFF